MNISSLVILFVLTVVSAVVAYVGYGNRVIDAYAPNIVAGFICAFFIVLLIDLAAERRQGKTRRRLEQVALAGIRLPLLGLAELLADMMKSAMPKRPDVVPTTYAQLFSKTYTDHLDWLNPGGSSGDITDLDWSSRSETIVKIVRSELSAVIDKYVAFVDVELIDLVEDVRSDPFLSFLEKLSAARTALRKAKINGSSGDRVGDFEAF